MLPSRNRNRYRYRNRNRKLKLKLKLKRCQRNHVILSKRKLLIHSERFLILFIELSTFRCFFYHF